MSEQESAADFLQRLGMDGMKWAEEFVKLHGGDLSLIHSWFANAIMAGYDHANWKAEKKLAAALEVVEAVRYCGARIETIGHGFDARNVYVVDLKLMEKIGDALQKFDKASKTTSEGSGDE